MEKIKQIFIIGAPRSGTTIIAQAIDCHPIFKIYDEVFLLKNNELTDIFLKNKNIFNKFDNLVKSGKSISDSIISTMQDHVGEGIIWGEKMPDYSFIVDDINKEYPDSVFVFVMRDPRRIAKSYFNYKDSEFRLDGDYWISDSCPKALDIIQRSLKPLDVHRDNLITIRYEEFVSNPVNALNRSFKPFNLVFSKKMLKNIRPLESFGDPGGQFLDNGKVLPWKQENLNNIKEQKDIELPEDVYLSSAWKEIEALAHSLGYK